MFIDISFYPQLFINLRCNFGIIHDYTSKQAFDSYKYMQNKEIYLWGKSCLKKEYQWLLKIAGEQVEVYINDKYVAKGEVIVIEDKFGIRVTNTNVQQKI